MKYALLTERQTAMLQAVANGRRDKQIASDFGIAVTTFSNHLTTIRHKLKAKTRAHLVAEALRQGYIR